MAADHRGGSWIQLIKVGGQLRQRQIATAGYRPIRPNHLISISHIDHYQFVEMGRHPFRFELRKACITALNGGPLISLDVVTKGTAAAQVGGQGLSDAMRMGEAQLLHMGDEVALIGTRSKPKIERSLLRNAGDLAAGVIVAGIKKAGGW